MIVMTNSDKGGTGKSTVAHVVANYFIEQGNKPVIIELDSINPDVGRCFGNDNLCQCENINITVDADKVRLQNLMLNIVHDAPNRNVIINCPTCLQKEMAAVRSMLHFANPVILWAIDPFADALRFLNRFIDYGDSVKICTIGNGLFCAEKTFELFRSNAPNIPFVYLPKANSIPMFYLYAKHVPIHRWHPESKFPDKMKLNDWREAEDWVIKTGSAIKEALRQAKLIGEIQ